jgi:hypothetical protein
MDVVCLSSEIPLFDEFFAFENEDVINGAVLFFHPADPLMQNCLEEAVRIGRRASWGEIGPRLVTRKAKESGRLREAQPQSTCYPVHHSEALDLLRPAQAGPMSDRTRGSLFLHLWNEVFRRLYVAKTMLPPRGSHLRLFADRHPVEGWLGEYDADALEHAISVELELTQLRKETETLRKKMERRGLKGETDSKTIASKLNTHLRAAESALASLARYLSR